MHTAPGLLTMRGEMRGLWSPCLLSPHLEAHIVFRARAPEDSQTELRLRLQFRCDGGPTWTLGVTKYGVTIYRQTQTEVTQSMYGGTMTMAMCI